MNKLTDGIQLTVVVVNYNDALMTSAFVDKISKYKLVDRIIVVDNASTDDSYSILGKLTGTKVDVVKTPYNGGYGYGNNYGIRMANDKYNSKYTLISNPDIDFEEQIIQCLIRLLENDENAVAASGIMKDIYQNPQISCAWKIPTINHYIFSAGRIASKILKKITYSELLSEDSEPIIVDCLGGAFFLVDTERMLEYGMFDEKMFLYCEETCLGIKIHAHHKHSLIARNCSYIHEHGHSINASYKSAVKRQNMILLNRKYLLKYYMHANKFQLIFADVFYKLCLLETAIVTHIKLRES